MICVGVCDRMNTLYLLVEETEIVSTSVKVYCACINSLRRSLTVSLEKYICLLPDMFCTAFSHAKPPRDIHAAREVTLSRF